jgi:uncharacterized repeat protein (TIGR01451 family)
MKTLVSRTLAVVLALTLLVPAWGPMPVQASVTADHVVINEFVALPTSAEAVELFNPTASAVDVSGWTLDWVYGSTTIDAGQVVAAGGYLVLTNANTGGLSVSNDGTVFSLVDGGGTTVDSVGYGDDGGAPKPIYNFSTGRSPDGVDTDDDAADFNMDATPTLGAANDHAAAALGAEALRINEVMPNDVSAEEGVAFIELYNTSTSAVDLADYMLQASDDYVFPTGTSIAAGGFLTVAGTTIHAGAGFFNLGDTKDNLYLYDASGARIDQLGWDGRSDVVANGESFQRDPDGAGPWDGYSWATSGGDSTLFQRAPTEGDTNVSMDFLVSKSEPAYVAIGEAMVYAVTLDNQGTVSATNVVMTETLEGLTYLGDDSGVTPANPATGVYVWQLGPVPTGTTTVHITTTVDAAVTPGASVTNTVALTLDLAGDDPANNSAQSVSTALEVVDIATARAGAEGEVFAVKGDVIVAPGTYNYTEWALQDATGGIAVYDFPPPDVALGDAVLVIGERGAYAGQEQFVTLYHVARQGAGPAVTPRVFATGDVDAGLSEGWLAQMQGVVAGLSDCGDSTFTVDDGSGAAQVYVDSDTDVDLCARGVANGDVLAVAGYSTEHYGDDQIKPRADTDVVLAAARPLLEKDAPATVQPGEAFTYTLTVRNFTGINLTGVVVTDVLPTNTAFAYGLDEATLTGDVVRWDLAEPLTDQLSVDVRFVVTATGPLGDDIWNADYAVQAANWITPAFGAPVFTYIGAVMPIYAVQGDGFTSPYEAQQVTTRGVVVGIFEDDYDGFFIQDPTGDGDTGTSDAILIYSDNDSVTVGQQVTVTGEVQEYSEWDGAACTEACQTQIASDPGRIVLGPVGTPLSALPVDPPGAPAAGLAYWEAHEGMLLTVPATATVVGPTSYGMIYVVPGDLGLERVLRTDLEHAGMPVGAIAFNGWGQDLIVGSIVSNVDGPLAQTYDNYAIVTQPGDDLVVETAAQPPATVPAWPEAAADTFSAATYNTYRFHADTGSKMTKVVSTVIQMGCPTFLSLQEIDVDTTMTNLLANLDAAGCAYGYDNSHPDIGGHGVALLWRTDRVSDVVGSSAYQACSPYGSETATAYDPITATCGADEYPLFSRRPVVVTGTVGYGGIDRSILAIAVHLKSKIGGEAADMRRLEQAQFLSDLAGDFAAQGMDYIMVLGDLNDFEDSDPLMALYAGGTLTNTWMTLPEDARYSYIYQGTSQILDHVLASPALMARLMEMGPLHYNADFPHTGYAYDAGNLWRSSDHDPVAATFSLEARPDLAVIKSVVPEVDVLPGGTVTYTLVLSNTGEDTASGVYLTDTLPVEIAGFGMWVSQPAGAGVAGRTITWTGTIDPETPVTLAFTAQVRDATTIQLGTVVTNTVTFTSVNAGTGGDAAVFVVGQRGVEIFLPILMRND